MIYSKPQNSKRPPELLSQSFTTKRQTMKNRIFHYLSPLLLLLLLLLAFLSLLMSSSCADDSSVYESMLSCLVEKNPDPSGKITSIVYNPSNSSYTSVLQFYIRNRRFNTSETPKPVIIVTPLSYEQVSATVLCAKNIGIQIKIRSGGHDYDGISYVSEVPFIILDMFNLRSISVNVEEETAWVEAGATLGELYYRIYEKSKVLGFPAGVCPTVGVGGHISGGGYGNMLRKYGLTVDHVVDAKMVDVNGKIRDREAMGEDLFWAIRGGGGASFGVVLAYKVKLVPVPETVTYFRVAQYIEDNATDMVYKWQFVSSQIDNDLFMRMLLQPVSSKTNSSQKTIRATIIALFLGDSDRLVSLLSKEFPELGLQKSDCQEMSWIESVLIWANFDNQTAPEALLNRTSSVNFLKRKSDYVQRPLAKSDLEALWKVMISLGKTGFVFNPYGGKMAEIAASATPFPHRAGNLWKIQYSVNWNVAGEEADDMYISQIRQLYSYMTPYVSSSPRGAFLNYRDLDIGTMAYGTDSYEDGSVYGRKYFMDNFDRLVKVKTLVDPDNFFSNEQSIPTSPN